jgi:hypothetical protein
MGKLKPIGSEKLSGMEKINRMIEISRYKENIPTPINEDKSLEYSIKLADGNKYQIIKEKTGYVITRNLTESNTVEYLSPLKNRKFYPSYSQAFKRLNLIAKELNTLSNSSKNISLFTEGENGIDDDEKYFLTLPELDEQTPTPPTPAPVPAPAPAPEPSPEGQNTPTEEPVDNSVPPSEEMPSEEPMDSENNADNEEVVTMKTLQKLTGKLGQKIREFKSNEENVMSSNDIKYIINSVLSALDLSSLDDEDKEQIMSKFEGGDSDEDMGDNEMPSDEMPSDEMPSEETPTEEPIAPPAPQGEMAEYFDDLPSKFRRKRHHIPNLEKKHSDSVGEFFEGVFNESKIDKVIGKYFLISESEQKQIQKNKKTISKIKNLSENITQEIVSRKFFEKNPSSELVGKTSKKNLVFKLDEQTIRITPNGKTI